MLERMLVDNLLSMRKADSAPRVQVKGELIEVNWVRGATTLL